MEKTAGDPRIERTRRVVLDATAALIGEIGFGRTSIEAIAERSGVARSTIYRHWPDRPDLLMEAVGHKIVALPPMETGTLRLDLVALLAEVAERLRSPETGPVLISLIAEARRDPQMAAVFAKFTAARFERIRSILDEGVARGDLLDDVDLEQATEDLVAPLFFRALFRMTPIDRDYVERRVDRWLEIYRP